MAAQAIVSKLWNFCNVLWDDGITYCQYVTGLTYILFLKMAKETGAESAEEAVANFKETVDLLMSVVKELRALEVQA